MYTPNEIGVIQQQAIRLHLKYPEYFKNMPQEELSRIANGYGAERWPYGLRKIITWVFRYYPAPAAIHDVRYEFSDGSELSRKAADAEFSANLRIVWQHRYGKLRWFNVIAIYAFFKITAAVNLTVRFGRSAWMESFSCRRKESSNE